MIVITYIKRLFGVWATAVFAALDLLALIVNLSIPNIQIPVYIYASITIVGFVVANIQLFAQSEAKLKDYESKEGNITIQLIRSALYFTPEILGDHTTPSQGWIIANVKIANLGEENGALEWDVDWKKSRLASGFVHNFSNGKLFTSAGGDFSEHIKARTGVDAIWELPFDIRQLNRHDFNNRIGRAKEYNIMFRYRTRRLGGASDWRYLKVEGDYSLGQVR